MARWQGWRRRDGELARWRDGSGCVASEVARFRDGEIVRRMERLEEEYDWYREMMRARNPAADREAIERIAAVRGIDEDGEVARWRAGELVAAGAACGKTEFATPRVVSGKWRGGEGALLKFIDYLEAEIRDLTALIEDKDKELREWEMKSERGGELASWRDGGAAAPHVANRILPPQDVLIDENWREELVNDDRDYTGEEPVAGEAISISELGRE